MMKNTRGFSYIEILVAMALFSIAMLAILPTLSQAGRNMSYARNAYSSHLQAQRIMLLVRDALKDGLNPDAVAVANVPDGYEFSFWVFGSNPREFHTSICPIKSEAAIVEIGGINSTIANQASTIVVVVWGDNQQVAGRAIGILYLNNP